MNLSDIDIHELLPQREPFVMVGRLTAFDMQTTVTETEVSPGNIFVDSGEMTPSGVIENIAQTCAARIGYINKYILGKGIQLGLIGAVRRLGIHRCPRVGETLVTTVRVEEEVFGMILATATVIAAGDPVAECEIKIALSEKEARQEEP